MTKELRVAVIGVGFIGTAHARAARSVGATSIGIAASSVERAKEAAAAWGATRWFRSAEDAVADPEVDVVHICTPNHLHFDLAAAALAAGKHVVCEKPLAFNPVDAATLEVALGDAGTVGTVPFVYRFHPMLREARAQVASGELGRIHLVHGTYLQDWLSKETDTDWRIDPVLGGPSRALADIGSHWFDLAEFVLGDRIRRLSARTAAPVAPRGTEDQAVVQIETLGGTIGSVVISQVAPGRKNALTLEVSGTLATAQFDQERPGSLWLGRRESGTIIPADPRVLSADAARLVVVPPGHPQGYFDCVDLFVADTYAAIAGAVPDGLPTFADGRRATVLVDTALRSAAVGGDWLEVPS